MEENDPENAFDICEEMIVRMPAAKVPLSRVLMTAQGILMELSVEEELPGRTVYELPAARRARARELAIEVTRDMFEIQSDAIKYYYSLDANRFQSVAKERRIVKQVADVMVQTVSLYMPEDSLGVELAAELEALEAMMAEEEARLANLGSFEF